MAAFDAIWRADDQSSLGSGEEALGGTAFAAGLETQPGAWAAPANQT